jgi:hypothetical protein
MKLIYEYADPINVIRKHIDNHFVRNNLDEIMCNRMKKIILNKLNKGLEEYYLYSKESNEREIFVNKTNINDINMRDLIINAYLGYKDCYLYQISRKTKICGLQPYASLDYNRSQMIKDLNQVKPNIIYKKRSTKQLYKLWIKL